MKQFLLSAIFLLAAFQVYARKIFPYNQFASIKDSNVRSILYKQLARSPALKGTELLHRFTGYSCYDLTSGSLLVDSSKYYYSGNRGSSFANTPENLNASFTDVSSNPDSFFHYIAGLGGLERDNSISYQYDNLNRKISSTYKNDGWLQIEHLYNSNGTLIQEKFYELLNGVNSLPALTNTETYIHNDQNKVVLDSFYDLYSNIPVFKYEYEYDAAGQLSVATLYLWTDSWKVHARASYLYDAARNNTFYQIEVYDSTLSLFTPVERGNLTYNSYNNLTRSIIETTKSVHWDSTRKDSITYSGNNPLPTYIGTFSKNPATRRWEGVGGSAYHLDNPGRWDTIYILAWDATKEKFKPDAKAYIIYNSNNLVATVGTYDYNDAAGAYDPNIAALFNYYYENIETAVPTVLASESNINTYPNPVKQTLHVTIPRNLVGQKVKMTIINPVGQIMISATANPNNSNTDIDVSSIPSGIYWIYFNDEYGKSLFKQGIEKLD